MSRPRNTVPSYRHHKPSGRAYSDYTDPLTGVRRSICLGEWNSPASRAEHARLCLELSKGRVLQPTGGLTVAELMLAFLRHAEQHYRRPDGSNTDELANVKQMIKVVRESHGQVPVREFGPVALRAVRQRMIDRGWSRKNINLHVGRVRRMFKYGVEHELVPAAVWEALRAVTGLQAGRTSAKETKPVSPVADELIDLTVPHLNRHVAGLIRFQRLTGCRPGEACSLRRCDLDTTGTVWVFRPKTHKLSYQGRGRTIHLGPQAQTLLAEFPTATSQEYIFSPKREREERNIMRARNRTTKHYPSRQGWQQRKDEPKRAPGVRYTVGSYGYAIRRACKQHDLEPWHPNQIRHTFGTFVRKEFGLEAAQCGLGHDRADVTQIYAERNDARAAEVAKLIG